MTDTVISTPPGTHRPRRTARVAGALLAGAVVFAAPVVAAAPAHAGGGVDISSWCKSYYKSSYFKAVLVSNNVYGWQCQYGTDASARFNVDMNGACRLQYGSASRAGYRDYNNPYSWYCT